MCTIRKIYVILVPPFIVKEKKKVRNFLISGKKNNSILLSHYINIITDTVCTKNHTFPRERL